MSDCTTTVKEIAKEIGCSVPTVNNKAHILGIKLKGRTTEEHKLLLAALRQVTPRVRKGNGKTAEPASSQKAETPRQPKNSLPQLRATTGIDINSVDAYFKHGRSLINEIRRRLGLLEKEREQLNEKLNALLLMNPNCKAAQETQETTAVRLPLSVETITLPVS